MRLQGRGATKFIVFRGRMERFNNEIKWLLINNGDWITTYKPIFDQLPGLDYLCGFNVCIVKIYVCRVL